MILHQMYPTITPYCVAFDIQLSAVRSTSETTFPPSKVKWEKIDKEQYRDIVTVSIAKVDRNTTTLGALDAEMQKLNQVLVKASEIVSEYDQEIPQTQTAYNPVAPRGRAAQPSQDTKKTNKAKQSALSSPSR